MELELSLLKSEKTNNKSFLLEINSEFRKKIIKNKIKKKNLQKIHSNDLLKKIKNLENEKINSLKKNEDLKISLEKYKKSSNYFLKENDLLKSQFFQKEETIHLLKENLYKEKKKLELKDYETKFLQNSLKSEKEITILLNLELENKKRQLNSKILSSKKFFKNAIFFKNKKPNFEKYEKENIRILENCDLKDKNFPINSNMSKSFIIEPLEFSENDFEENFHFKKTKKNFERNFQTNKKNRLKKKKVKTCDFFRIGTNIVFLWFEGVCFLCNFCIFDLKK